MALTKEQLGALMSPISRSRVKVFGQDKGQKAGLAYVEAFDIKASLVRVFGFGGFSAEVIRSEIISIITSSTHPEHTTRAGDPKTPQVLALATVQLSIPSLSAVYTESAVGSNSGWDIGEVADNAIKSAASDALKRCATYLGSQFGLSLYSKDNQAAEVVGVIFEPEQAQMLAEVRAEAEARREALTERTQAVIDRATGAEE